jgi:hypothetical protein
MGWKTMRVLSVKVVFVWALLAAGAFGPAVAGGNVNFVAGGRGLDRDFWGDLDEQDVFGVMADYTAPTWPVRIEGAIFFSSRTTDFTEQVFFTTSEVEGRVSELAVGLNKTWDTRGRTRPFVGGGLAWVVAEEEIRSEFFGDAHEDAEALGVYVHGGIFWRVGATFNLGFDARLMGTTDIGFFQASGDASYGQVGILLGWGWPPFP